MVNNIDALAPVAAAHTGQKTQQGCRILSTKSRHQHVKTHPEVVNPPQSILKVAQLPTVRLIWQPCHTAKRGRSFWKRAHIPMALI